MRYFGILCAVKAHAIATTFTSSGTTYFNDMRGTTLGAKAKGKKYSAAALTKMRGQIPRNPFFKGPAGSVPLRSRETDVRGISSTSPLYLSPLRGSGGEPDCFLTCILNIMK